MKLSDGGLPKGYEGCTSVKEIASRKKVFESQPLQKLTGRGLNGQSWKSLKTPSTNSRSFSTFHAAWNTPDDKPNVEERPAQNWRTQFSATLEANMLEAKRQYQVARRTLGARLRRSVNIKSLDALGNSLRAPTHKLGKRVQPTSIEPGFNADVRRMLGRWSVIRSTGSNSSTRSGKVNKDL
jgi:hypothetical protein